VVACGVGISTLTEDLKYLAQGMVAFIPLLGVPLSNLVFTWHSNHTNPALPHLIQTIRSQAEGESLRILNDFLPQRLSILLSSQFLFSS
jgi:hypothetical protein